MAVSDLCRLISARRKWSLISFRKAVFCKKAPIRCLGFQSRLTVGQYARQSFAYFWLRFSSICSNGAKFIVSLNKTSLFCSKP